jgi:hypothetical protein
MSIEFQSIKNNLVTSPKNFFSTFNSYNLAIHAVAKVYIVGGVEHVIQHALAHALVFLPVPCVTI